MKNKILENIDSKVKNTLKALISDIKIGNKIYIWVLFSNQGLKIVFIFWIC
ncbi:hypothetical protein HYD88_02375 [Mycoplasmopsis bovis]|nr:hypothetical protein [Mycoplasmopsis bovis]QQH36310.1 hypothetical protein HYD88_02375 [Mycoplasmopsis bovis]QQH78234.1 hypothetical protein HYD46_02355 [Mycoplasmopsis bovis]